jgi:hypothetical protein
MIEDGKVTAIRVESAIHSAHNSWGRVHMESRASIRMGTIDVRHGEPPNL